MANQKQQYMMPKLSSRNQMTSYQALFSVRNTHPGGQTYSIHASKIKAPTHAKNSRPRKDLRCYQSPQTKNKEIGRKRQRLVGQTHTASTATTASGLACLCQNLAHLNEVAPWYTAGDRQPLTTFILHRHRQSHNPRKTERIYTPQHPSGW